jgi:ABC-2 type transport system permease protein
VVALLVRLKLTLLRNSLRRSVWRTVGLILGMVYGLGAVVAVIVGLIALRFTSTALTADVTVVAFTTLSLGWLLMSLLVFGVDETVDPAKFALLPVRSRELLPGLLAGGLIGVPGIATVLISAGLIITWARTPALLAAAIVAFPLGVVTCLLLARAVTAAFAAVLASRRFRDLAFVGLALFGVSLGLAGNLIGAFGSSDPAVLREGLADLALLAGWSPFGWAWMIPADVARGQWLYAGIHLLLAVALVGVLWRAWEYFLAARLTSPVEAVGESRKVRASSWVERLYPATPAGGVAGRCLRYWRRDPRYLAGIAGFMIAPVIIIVTQMANPDGLPELAAFAPALVGWLVGISIAQDLSYDGSAVWLHVSSGLRGADDRAGRVWATMTVYLPVTVLLFLAAFITSGEWGLLVPVAGVTAGLMLSGLGVGSWVGALWQWPAPPPGANPFQTSNTGGLPAVLSFTVTSFGTLIVSAPTIGLIIWSFFTPWVGYLALPVGLATGLLALRIGITQGGRILDRRWPEALKAISEKAG